MREEAATDGGGNGGGAWGRWAGRRWRGRRFSRLKLGASARAAHVQAGTPLAPAGVLLPAWRSASANVNIALCFGYRSSCHTLKVRGTQ